MDNTIYLQLKDYIRRDIGKDIFLEDIAQLSCPSGIGEEIRGLVVLSGNKVGITVISIVEIIEIIRQVLPSAPILSVGEPRVIVQIDRKNPSGGHLVSIVKAIITSLLFFIGSGLAIMYFHADVNMHEVHKTIYLAVTGQKSNKMYWINIPYSIGIGLGIALFFGILPNKDRSLKPDPLKIGIYKHKKDIDEYIETEARWKHNNR